MGIELARILREAISLLPRNGKLMLSITLLVLVPLSLLVLVHNLVLGPLMEKIEDNEDGPITKVEKDIGLLVGLEIPFFIAFCVLFLFGLTATILSSAMTYTGKPITLKEMFLRIKVSWKRPFITWLCISLLTVSYILLVVVLIGAFTLVTTFDALIFVALITLVGFSAALFYLHLATVWMLSLVISVVEENYHGMKAIAKAVELIRGRKLQGFALILLLVLLTSPISVLFNLISFDDDLGAMTRFAFGFVGTAFFCMAKLFTFVVFTVYYYECKKSHDEEQIEMNMGSGYSLVPTNVHLDASMP